MRFAFMFLLAIPFFAAGCNDLGTQDGKFRVATTTSLLADAVNRVGGEHVRVECLMGPGIDPHRYTATPGDIRKLAEADLILFHGLHLEGKMDDVLSKNPPKKSVAVCEQLKPEALLKADHGGDGPYDPHVWMDPLLWAQVVEMVRDELVAADPAHADAYKANCKKYVQEIHELHEANKKLVESLPREKRKLVTSHDAFSYFGKAYDFEVHGLQGISTASEPSTKDVSELAKFLGSNRITAVFTETSVPPKGLEAVLDNVRKDFKYTIKLIGDGDALYSDALGEAGTPGETYLGMMRHNVSVIVNGLK